MSGRRAAVGERVTGVGVYRARLAPTRLPHGGRRQQPQLQSAPTGPAAKVRTTTLPTPSLTTQLVHYLPHELLH